MPGTVADVAVTDALPTERGLMGRLLQLYLHDFSEFAQPGALWGEVDADGFFAYAPPLDAYWTDRDRLPLLIRADGKVAGFVLLNRWSALDLPLDRAVAEFFVLRKYRRARVGTRAAHVVFRRFPGHWEVPIAGYNKAALHFWRTAVAALPLVPSREQAGDGQRWFGTVLVFKVASGS